MLLSDHLGVEKHLFSLEDVVNGTSVNWFVYSYESMSHLSIPMLKDEAIIKEYLLDSAHLKTVLTMLI